MALKETDKMDEWQVAAKRIDAAFVAWLEKEGVEHEQLEWPCLSPYGERMARTKTAMRASTPYMSVPESLMLTPSCAMTDVIVGPASRDLKIRGDTLLAVFILNEARKGKHGKWYPYLRSLPLVKPNESNQSLGDWDKEIQILLGDENLIVKAKQRRRWIVDLYERVIRRGLCAKYSEQFPLEWYTLERFETSWQLVQSRAFGRRLKESALVPLADALNHGDVETEYALVSGQFRLWPLNDVAKGNEALNAYGSDTNNAKLLLDYGFALPQNRFDSLSITVSLHENDPLLEAKRRILRTAGLGLFGIFTIKKDQNPAHPSSQLDALRIAVASKQDIDLMQAALGKDYCDKVHRSNSKLCCPDLNTSELFHVARVIALRKLLTLLDEIITDSQSQLDAHNKRIISCEAELIASAEPRRDRASWFWEGTQDSLGPKTHLESSFMHRRIATERTLFALRYRTTRSAIAISAREHILTALSELEGR
uniref:SET domain-containing protein n=1 Tax=Aureoumbra lagunensis TaxID=44058 RepID=A0A7S3JSE9_9STRA|mmetsp:Transcript_11468/g.15667  ORF Transcript_11468/g.15667 Transcript_11468/m.15667 type:complete len:482 (-) Transcript_11468:774-2219(-)|eukprot:CAMPEP_0197285550 /NCGR_PEP_ID=MMETSP0890-20130614/874_1 /TAXON_ID=44058 ORGANISM="Aureoumbra lagunensis, Strain CCMP1510" /NCGR_SAMPLE_ID=MMETSP0890 /ASSEMBLY_ACC=CAM_ASM_000533 /LENGTH=481 /DNA_ID=CAMNT_0042753183 /DNA_START=158 /DNA_END=1603 /DNA_ORIENTATION=+